MRIALITLMGLMLGACDITSQGTQFARQDPQRGLVRQSGATIPIGVRATGPVMLRMFKEEHQLELWRQNIAGVWTKARMYEICRFSGELGPKTRSADYQAPEGFYWITPGQLNPWSREYLSINTGYPNARDRSHGYTGGDVMLHGGCKSAGCFAMTDQGMEEIYAAVRDAMSGGQRKIQLQIYPFRMTESKLRTMSSNRHFAFWQELKIGYDYFERHRSPVPIGVQNGRYVLLDTR